MAGPFPWPSWDRISCFIANRLILGPAMPAWAYKTLKGVNFAQNAKISCGWSE